MTEKMASITHRMKIFLKNQKAAGRLEKIRGSFRK
jgi:hypothetical protein